MWKVKKFCILLIITLVSCQGERKADQATQAINSASPRQTLSSRAPIWEQEFYRTEGWFGGDGIFTIPLNGKEFVPATDKDSTLFIFSDSLIKLKGKIKSASLENGDYKMIHNSIGVLVGNDPKDNLNCFWRSDQEGMPESVFTPEAKDGHDHDYFWLGDGFVNTAHDSSLYIFAYRVRDIETDAFFPFVQRDVTLLKIEKGQRFPFDNHEQIKTDLLYELPGKFGKTTFGNAVLVNTKEAGAPHPDGYIYIYGVVGYFKELIVARVLPKDFEDMSQWTFFDGKGWTHDKYKVHPVTKNTANELSISPLANGNFIMVTQHNGMEPYVDIQMAKSPVGPFYPKKKIWYCDEVDLDKDYFAYNAKGHPHLSPEGKLLISYNVNSFDFYVDVLTHAHHYRPRFIHLEL